MVGMARLAGSWRAAAVLLVGAVGARLLQRRGPSAGGRGGAAAAPPSPVTRTSSYVEIDSSRVNSDVPTGLGAGQLWTDFHIASPYTSFGQCTFKNGGATILVATMGAPNYDASAHFATPVVLNGPLTVNCPGAIAKVFVSGYQ
jgi:hypothetical protein